MTIVNLLLLLLLLLTVAVAVAMANSDGKTRVGGHFGVALARSHRSIWPGEATDHFTFLSVSSIVFHLQTRRMV